MGRNLGNAQQVKSNWVIYGANGYTGRLIAIEAKRRGMNPWLAGRNEESVASLARELGFKHKSFACENGETIAREIEGASLVLHCAGPFSATARPMLDGCIKARAHYLDITGEIPIFERVQRYRATLEKAGIVAIPGVGFDVVPSDCLAAMLKEKLPDAVRLRLALKISASPSQGTYKTLVEGMYAGTIVRRAGKLERLPGGSLTRDVVFWDRTYPNECVAISWGDVSTAFHSTGIADIETYLATNAFSAFAFKGARYLAPVLALESVQGLLKKAVERWVQPPNDEQRDRSPYFLWGRVENERGEFAEMQMRTPNGYSLTVDSALQATTRVLEGAVRPGAWTPSLAFGKDFVRALSGVEIRS